MPLTGTWLIGGKANALECQRGHQRAQGRRRADRQINFAGDNDQGFANSEHNTDYSSPSIRFLTEANSHISPEELGGFPPSFDSTEVSIYNRRHEQNARVAGR
jgi:hypothetical protein